MRTLAIDFILEFGSYRLPDKRYLMRLGPQMYVDASKDIPPCTLPDAPHRHAFRCNVGAASFFNFWSCDALSGGAGAGLCTLHQRS